MEKRKIKYTKKLHAHRLGVMLSRQNPCDLCPAAPNFNSSRLLLESSWNTLPWEVHKICMEFVGIVLDDVHCPCRNLGEAEAIKRSIKALKDYYA